MVIDNGNHLLLSGNHAALAYLATHRRRRRGLPARRRPNSPSWTSPAASDGRCGSTTVGCRGGFSISAAACPEHVRARLSVAGSSALGRRMKRPICETVTCAGPLYERLVRPLLLAALNTEPKRGDARRSPAPSSARRWPRAARPAGRSSLATDLGQLSSIRRCAFSPSADVKVAFRAPAARARFRRSTMSRRSISASDQVALGADDRVILAVPPRGGGRRSCPVSTTPDRVPRHRQCAFPPRASGRACAHHRRGQRHGRMAVLLSAIVCRSPSAPPIACSMSRARRLARQSGRRSRPSPVFPATLPPWQIVRERRATFAATPAENAKRPGAQTAWNNLVLAGDWTATGLPATIEGAIRSGNRAADLVVCRDRGMVMST